MEFTLKYGLGFQMKMDGKPTLVWDFNPLKMMLKTVYGLLVLREDAPLRMCKHCEKVFFATHGRRSFVRIAAATSTIYIKAEERITQRMYANTNWQNTS